MKPTRWKTENRGKLILKLSEAKSPMELGWSADTRRLGLALIKLQIDSQDGRNKNF